MNNALHTPLFLKEILALLKERNASKVIDGTFAEGGHGLRIAESGIKVLGIEWDEEMYKVGQANIKTQKARGVTLTRGNYRDVAEIAAANGFVPVDAIIFDLGLSMYQLRNSAKGFSLERSAPLDLRISQSLQLSGAQFLNTAGKEELEQELAGLMEDRLAGDVLSRLESYRRKRPLNTVEDLRLALAPLNLPDQQTNRLMRKLLQSLRIVVNDEFVNIRKGFMDGLEILLPHGLLIFLTYHSLEDRLVKRLGTEAKGRVQLVQKVLRNKDYKFAQSGKLRIYEKSTI